MSYDTPSSPGRYEMIGLDPSSQDPIQRSGGGIPPRKPLRKSTMDNNPATKNELVGGSYAPVVTQVDPQGNNYYNNNSYNDPSDPYRQQTRTARWGITWWRTPLISVLLLLSGVLCAVGNHIYFSHLDGTKYQNGEWVPRYALVLAFVVKASLVACIDLTYLQLVWHTLRNRENGVSLRGIDALFQVLHDLKSFLVTDLWRSAPIATILAIITWVLPLVSIVAPTTLSVKIANQSVLRDCTVPTIDFAQNVTGALANANKTGENINILPEDLSRFEYTGYYERYSVAASKIGRLTAYMGESLSGPSPCGPNCTFLVSFRGPAWRCNATDPGDRGAAWLQKPKDNNTIFSPPVWVKGDEWDPAKTDVSKNSGYVIYANTYLAMVHNETGDFWIGHATPKKRDTNKPRKGPYTYFDAYDVETFKCNTWNTTYTVNLTYEGGERKFINITEMKYINNVTVDGDNFFRRSTFPDRIGTASFISMWDVIKEMLSGWIRADPRIGLIAAQSLDIYSIPSLVDPIAITNTTASISRPQQPFAVKPEIREAVEKLSQDYTLSLLAQPLLQYRKAARPANGKCKIDFVEQQWRYKPRDLLITYAVAIGAAIISMIIGVWVIMSNGLIAGMTFSTILMTTRNADLDAAVKGNCLGSEEIKPGALGKMRLRFGEILPEAGIPNDGSGKKHASFGSPGTVGPLEKNAEYS